MIDVQNGTNGLELALQGGGNFTGGYITTNQFGLTVLSSRQFHGQRHGDGHQHLAGHRQSGGQQCDQRRFDLGGGQWLSLWNSATVTILTNSTVIVTGGTL